MNKYIYSIIALLMMLLCPAQSYVSQAEYFWDTDPGVGNGTAVSAADGTFNSVFEQLTKTGIAAPSNGLHKFSIRIKDNTGVWGPIFSNVINVQQNQTSALMAISQAEYFWDTDPGVGNGTAVLAADGNFDSSFEQLTKTGIALPASGLHVFNIRIKDNTGVWGPAFKNVINVQAPTSTGCWQTLSAGAEYSLGIKTDGTLWAWGNNLYGQLGDGTTVDRNIPIQIGTANNWLKIDTNSYYSLAIKADGTLWAWGMNSDGQLGDGTKIDRFIPTQIGTATNWKSISAGVAHSLAIKTDGTLWGWGRNNYGQLGDGTTIGKIVPTQLGTATDWQSISAGVSHTLALKTNGTLWGWGRNNYGQLGDGTTTAKTIPVQIGTATNWKSIDAGDHHSIGTKTNGMLWGWGYNQYGQLGDGTTMSKIEPTQIGTGTNWLNIAAGTGFTFANKTDGTLWSWGDNAYGQLGNGTNGATNTLLPTQVGASSDNMMIFVGGYHVLQQNTGGVLKVCGRNEFGQLGDGTNIKKNTFISIACPSNCTPPTQFSTTNITSSTATLNWTASAPNGSYLYLYSTNPIVGGIDGNTPSTTASLTNLLPNTTYYWWVSSYCGSSQGNWIQGGSFTTLSTNTTGCWKSVSAGYMHSIGLKTDGTLWAWGDNSLGQLGDGTGIGKTTPIQIGTANNWLKIATGAYYTVAIKTDGTLWAWGQNTYGQLGSGSTVGKITPTQIGTETDWASIATGDTHALAIKTNGTLWSWGRNSAGQLGDGTNLHNFTPTQVGTANNWEAIAAGVQHTFAIKTNGTLWGWGDNASGQLGDGTTFNRKVPTQIGTATNWKTVDAGYLHSVGLKTDGTIWSWGNNTIGQLGSGTTNSIYTPSQIGNATNWKTVSADYYHSSVAIKTDGTLWAWGQNNAGQLGDGTTTNRYIPTQIGSATDRKSVAANTFSRLVINNDGFLSGAGRNDYGQIGDGTKIERKIFVPVACPASNLAVDEIIIKSDNLKVFPNPVQDYLTVSFDQKILSVMVYSAAGQLVTTKMINDTKGTVDFSAFASGVYLVTVNAANNFVKTVKVIKR
ncbi:T9SS type A sorting domain-containing protein [Chryseobacterium sp. LC2016-29]|uniref:RCC1 domain-containing protein n=1 Tax=Chryseobacterium sp. LC2016-29 TaxID=2897331 RepID=UPI001E4E8971|nr:T9SS type A sorting domain-containing protein [Chryseobacterium sp. LC2016-29]MCD0478765.1 T9SS type A sorting domain-containing protein [Chryseobacterium sp. LC2016-29]